MSLTFRGIVKFVFDLSGVTEFISYEGCLYMTAIISLILMILNFYYWIVIASVILSWLISFNIVQYTNPIVRQIHDFLHQMTEPAFAFVRRFLPPIGGMDLSPIVIIFGLHFLKIFIGTDVARLLLG